MSGKVLVALAVALVVGGGVVAADAYIQGTGTQAILTDCCPGANSRVEVDFAFDEIENGMRAIGVETSATGNAFQFLVNGDNTLRFGIGNTWTGYYPGIMADTARHVAILDAKGGTLSYVTGGAAVWTTGITNATSRTGTWPLAVFGANKAAASLTTYQASGNYAKMKLYSLKVYENNTIAHYYKPWRSADGSFVGLKDLCTGSCFVNGSNDRGQFLAGGDISDSPAWDLDEPQPTITPEVAPTSGDYVFNVPSGTTLFRDGIDTDLRVVLQGGGTLVLGNHNRFGSTFVVSNGYLAADWSASGLSKTHLELVGVKNDKPAIYRPVGPTFTAPVAASGAGTIQFRAWCGLGPWDQDLTVNLGGDARVLKKGVDGFTPTEFDLGLSYAHTLTFENTIDMNNSGFILKNPYSSMPTYFTGCVTNSGGKASDYGSTANGAGQSGNFQYYDGTTVFVGRPGVNSFFFRKSSKFIPYCGTVIFSNCFVRVHNDTQFGNATDISTKLTVKYTGTTDHYADNAWDIFNHRNAESAIVVDGPDASYKHNLILFLGNSGDNDQKYQTAGHVIITNNGTVKLGTMAIHSGWVKQYSGLFEIPKTGYDDGDAIRIGGMRASSTPVANGRGSAAYYLYGGRFFMDTRSDLHIGSADAGLFEQTGGTMETRKDTFVGYHPAGSGTYNLHGGVYTNGVPSAANAMYVGAYGTGVVSVANGGRFLAQNSIQIGQYAGGVGRVNVDAGGEMTVNRVQGGAGTGAFVFNGGTLQAANNVNASAFIASSLTRAVVGANGGAFDTAGNGNFTFAKPLLAATAAEAPETLTHRWSFQDGSLVDSVSGLTATTVGSVACTDGEIVLAGGAIGSSQVKLGTNLIPTDGRGCTIELWFTQRSVKNFSRLLQCGLTQNNQMFFISSNRSGATHWYLSFAGGENQTGRYVLQNNMPYYISFTIRKLESGSWRGTATIRDATTGAVLETLSQNAASGWTPANLKQSDGLWLGNGAWGDPDPNAAYREVRVHSRALTDDELAASVQAGARRMFAFAKKGAGTLTLTGANTYTCGTAVEAGTLALAGGASLPATDAAVAAGATLDLNGAAQTFTQLSGSGTVADGTVTVTGRLLPGGEGTIGTLTLDGATLAASKFVVDVATNGACDRVVGPVDVTGMTLAVANPDDLNPEISYKVVDGVATGKFAATVLPRRWVATVSEKGVRIVFGGGSVVVVR